MYADGRWADNEHTAQGAFVHRNVDAREEVLPSPEEAGDVTVVRSLSLESDELGLRGKLDAVELRDGSWSPIEYKKGTVPPGKTMWPPERLQVASQVLLLRANGYRSDFGIVYYRASRTRVSVQVDSATAEEVRAAVISVRAVLAPSCAPSPLDDSPKCTGCSLSALCLPDETLLLRRRGTGPTIASAEGDDVSTGTGSRDSSLRRFAPARDDALPLYVQEQGATVGKSGESLVVRKSREELAHVRLLDVSQLVLCGNVSVTPQALALLCEASVPIVHLSTGNWFHGITHGMGMRSCFDRVAQYSRFKEPSERLRVSLVIVAAKLKNQRTLLRRNGPSGAKVLVDLKNAVDAISRANSLDALLGFEGHGAALYFGSFSTMLHPPQGASADADAGTAFQFDFQGRNRRPPKDPVNALLSFAYSLLAKDATVALLAAGLDPYWGFYHEARHGRPALALDLMEEFRAIIADSAVITAINTGVVIESSFLIGASGCCLTPDGRKAFLRCYEARMDVLMTHPIFDYRVSARRILWVQAALLARWLRDDIPEYIPIVVR